MMDRYQYVYDCYDRADDFRVSYVKVTVSAYSEEEALDKVQQLVGRQFYCLEEIKPMESI